MVQTGEHWLNPYVGVKMPRSGSSLNSRCSTILGLLFHMARGSESRYRIQTECTLKNGLNPEKDKMEVNLRTNASFAYNHFVFSALKTLNLTGDASLAAQISAAAVYDTASGYAQLDLEKTTPTLFTIGGGFKPLNQISFFAQAVQSLQKVEKAEKLANPSVTFGVDYAHCPGFGVKAAADLKGKLQTNFNFTANKYFSGSLLLDVSTSNDRPTFARSLKDKREISLGEPRSSSTAKYLIHVIPRSRNREAR